MRGLTNHLLLMGLAALAATAGAAPPKEEPPETRYAAMLEREYGPLGRTTDQILSREATHESATIVSALVYRIRAKPEERRSGVERKLLAAREVIEQVNDGGFNLYFTEATGDRAGLALQAFQEMGATQLLKLMQRAASVFPAGKPPADASARNAMAQRNKRRSQQVWSSCDDELYVSGEEFAALALAYVKKNRAQVVLP